MRFRIKAKQQANYKLWEPDTAPKKIKTEPGVLCDAIIVDDANMDNDGDFEPSEDELPRTATGKVARPVRVKLELQLSHGDIVVMKGSEIQRIWEVSFAICLCGL